MKQIILFVLTFFIVLIIYNIFIVSKTKKAKKKDILSKDPVEVKYLITRYNLDMKKLNYNHVLTVSGITSSLDIAIIVTIISFFDNFYLQMIIASIASIIIFLISYHLVYLYYKEKGMIKDV